MDKKTTSRIVLPDPLLESVEEAPSKPNLLVVDDEEGPRQSLKIVFRQDYNVLLATSGEEGLAIAKKHPVDVAVLDIMMAGMSGVELLGKLKEFNPAIEVIMLTAFETLETARQSLRYGACDYLNKPFDIATVRAAVAKAVERSRVALRLQNVHAELDILKSEIEDQRLREEISRTKGDIYASVLHDINSPLTVISGFAEIISCALQNAGTIEGQQLATIRQDVGHLSSQVTRCFEISRRYLSFLRENPAGESEVSVNQVLADLRDLLSRHPNIGANRLAVERLPEDVQAKINGTDLLQVLLNLTMNALQGSDEPHDVSVTAELLPGAPEAATIPDSDFERVINQLDFANEPPFVCITVSDNASGIPAHILGRLFDHQLTTKDASQGTGLGLSIVKRLLKEARALVHVRTQLGNGSTFMVCVPVQSGGG